MVSALETGPSPKKHSHLDTQPEEDSPEFKLDPILFQPVSGLGPLGPERGSNQAVGLEARLPNMLEIFQDLEQMVEWKGKNQDIPTPSEGLLPEYQEQQKVVSQISQELEDYLE